MHWLQLTERTFWTLGIAGQAFLIVRLITERLGRVYPFFFLYLLTSAATSLSLISLDTHTRKYTIAWMVTRPALYALQCLTAWELYAKVCEHYPGIVRYRRRLAALTGIVAGVVCLAGVQGQIAASKPVLFYMPVLMRTVNSGLLVFLLLLWGLFKLLDTIPVKRKHNVVVHLTLLAIYFGTGSLCALVAMNVSSAKLMYPLNVVMLAVNFVCLCVWCREMSSSGELMPVHPALPYDAEEVERSIRELRFKLRGVNPLR